MTLNDFLAQLLPLVEIHGDAEVRVTVVDNPTPSMQVSLDVPVQGVVGGTAQKKSTGVLIFATALSA